MSRLALFVLLRSFLSLDANGNPKRLGFRAAGGGIQGTTLAGDKPVVGLQFGSRL